MELGRVHELLETLPELKARKVEECENARVAYELANHELTRIKAVKLLAYTRENRDETVAVIKSLVDRDEDVHAQGRELIGLENNWKRLENIISSLDDQFTAVKVIARLKMAEMGSGVHRE